MLEFVAKAGAAMIVAALITLMAMQIPVACSQESHFQVDGTIEGVNYAKG